MSESDKILELIEGANPHDEAVMREIDARVWCYTDLYGKKKFDDLTKGIWDTPYWFDDSMMDKGGDVRCPLYTISRDALKSIRPDGWWPQLGFHAAAELDGFSFPDRWDCCLWHKDWPFKACRDMATEELAELHCIIQAIKWEREK